MAQAAERRELSERYRGSAQGWGADDGNFSPGVLAISAPVFSPTGAINYTLTAITFRDAQTKDKAVFGEALVSLADELTSVLY